MRQSRSDIKRTLLDALKSEVEPIPMTRGIYEELLEALNELDSAFKVTAESANARRWVQYRWVLEREEASTSNDPFPYLPVTGGPEGVDDNVSGVVT